MDTHISRDRVDFSQPRSDSEVGPGSSAVEFTLLSQDNSPEKVVTMDP